MAKTRIFIIEQDPAAARRTEARLHRLGHAVCGAAAPGDRAARMIGDLRPDVILMDAAPGVQTARNLASICGIPIICLTDSDGAGKLKADQFEFFRCLEKPFRDSELEASIQLVLCQAEMKRKVKEAEEVIDLNEFLRKEIAKREMAESRLDETSRQLRVLSSRLLEAQERERKLLADEIHDSIGSSLAAIKFSLEETVISLNQGQADAPAAIQKIIGMVQAAIEESRRISSNLRPSLIDDLGLLPTIRWLAEEFRKVYTDMTIDLRIDIDEDVIAEAIKIVIYRIIQEGLNNAAKYSEADTVSIRLKKEAGRIRLTVADNGVGCDLERIEKNDRLTGMGLRSMRERTHFSGGRFKIRSDPGEGMQIMVSWPARSVEGKPG